MIALLLDCLTMGFGIKQYEIHGRDGREGELNFRAHYLASSAIIQFVLQFIYVLVVFNNKSFDNNNEEVQPAVEKKSSVAPPEQPLEPETAIPMGSETENTATPTRNPKTLDTSGDKSGSFYA